MCSYPVAGRDELVRLIPSLRSKFPSYASFGASRVEDIFPAAELSQATVREARVFASSVALAQADGTYKLQPLPAEAQFSPVFASVVRDFDGDGHPDLLLARQPVWRPARPRPLRRELRPLATGLGDGRFTSFDRSDLGIEGEVRDMKLASTRGWWFGHRRRTEQRNPPHPPSRAMSNLPVLDLVVIASYFAILFGIGFWAARREKQVSSDYFLAGAMWVGSR